LDHVFPCDLACQLGVLHRDDQSGPQPDRHSGGHVMRIKTPTVVMVLYLLFLMLPIYWLVNMSLKTNAEITGTFSLYPHELTLRNYRVILTDPSWYMGYVNSIIYVVMNTVISVAVALPAA